MDLSDFDYFLPPELIAQAPAEPRDRAKLMVVNRQTGTWQTTIFSNLPQFLQPSDILIVNNSKVLPARLIGHKAGTGGKIEVLLEHKLVSPSGQESWRCLIGGNRPKVGLIINFPQDLTGQITAEEGDGVFTVEFNKSGSDFWSAVYAIGEMPLPPYIKADKTTIKEAVKDYQTVYAKDNKVGSVAAPTAGLHFTKELLKRIKAMGVEIVEVTLHVGLGTFEPVRDENIKEQRLHEELVEIGAQKINQLIKYHQAGRRLIAVGTTSVRVLEGVVAHFIDTLATDDWLAPIDLFISPGFEFKLLDGLITNFHLPKSSLIMLVSAWAGTDLIKKTYAAAIAEHYRFFSYGDAMFLV